MVYQKSFAAELKELITGYINAGIPCDWHFPSTTIVSLCATSALFLGNVAHRASLDATQCRKQRSSETAKERGRSPESADAVRRR